jgi:hypothetical protein
MRCSKCLNSRRVGKGELKALNEYWNPKQDNFECIHMYWNWVSKYDCCANNALCLVFDV